MKKKIVQVIFRRDMFNDFTHITAIFPGTYNRNKGIVACYSHNDKHSVCSYDWYRKNTSKASELLYGNLLKELTQIYSDCELKVVTRFSKKEG